jgi:hypothetical protein
MTCLQTSNPWKLHFHVTFILIENFVKIGAQLWIIKKLGCFDIKHSLMYSMMGDLAKPLASVI